MLRTADLDFKYPEELVATAAKPRGASRILSISRDRNVCEEINWARFLGLFQRGDTLVLNDSKVMWARLKIPKTSGAFGEIFFLKALNPKRWEVLSRGLNFKEDKIIDLPGDVKARVIKAGKPAEIEIETPVDLPAYFERWGHVPLPPYIKKEDGPEDKERYQTVWAKKLGSVAAPTAGLHFAENHLEELRKKGVNVEYVTLHVGAGTFLPIETKNVKDFQIHGEVIDVGEAVCKAILRSQATGKKVWACGTTTLRALETAVHASPKSGARLPLIAPFFGETRLFIQPGYRFLVVDGLLTNFHQPQSSLLALASAFATRTPAPDEASAKKSVEKLLNAYQFAVEKKFRLFSYGDLTVIS